MINCHLNPGPGFILNRRSRKKGPNSIPFRVTLFSLLLWPLHQEKSGTVQTGLGAADVSFPAFVTQYEQPPPPHRLSEPAVRHFSMPILSFLFASFVHSFFFSFPTQGFCFPPSHILTFSTLPSFPFVSLGRAHPLSG